MRDQPITREDLMEFTADFTTTLTTLNVQITELTIQLNNNAYNNTANKFRLHHSAKGHVTLTALTA
ncbi:hypothetical protein A2U01_0060817, partial [Trifolium medium]|nr:hypothetical protein [Trifolium medium]